MSVASSLWPPAERRSSMAMERFSTLSASLSSQSESRLQKPSQLFMPTTDDVATSISPSGWVAAASTKQIRLYNVKDANRSQHIHPTTTIHIPMLSRDEEVRAIAISHDLLAVVTHNRLLVFDEYSGTGHVANNLVEERRIDQDRNWTPRTVSIAQTGTASKGEGVAYVVVGGELENGVKMSKYIYGNCWTAQNDRLILKCPGNTGSIKTVGFSPLQRNAVFGPMIFALTTGNRLYTWRLGDTFQVGVRSAQPVWQIDCNSSNNQRVSS